MSPQSEMDEWAERRGEEWREWERETSLDHWACVLDTWFVDVCVRARASSYVRSLVRLLATSLKNCATLRSRGRATDFYCEERVFSRFSHFSNVFSEECLMERFGKVRILEREWKDFNLVSISMRKRSDFGIEKRVLFWDLEVFFREMFSGTIWRRIWRILEREWKNFNLVWISMRKRSDFRMRNEYYFEILRIFLEKCLMERFGKEFGEFLKENGKISIWFGFRWGNDRILGWETSIILRFGGLF